MAVTNGYALSVGGSNIKILNNTMDLSSSGSSRGIGMGDGSISNVEIGGNRLIVRENPNREYGNSGTTARALEIRCYAPSVLTNINVHDNYFEAITGAGSMQGATAARLVLVPPGSTGITFTNNTFKAICLKNSDGSDPGSQYYAHAIEIDDCEVAASSPIIFSGNTFESDGTGISLGGPATGQGYPVNNILFLKSILRITTDPTAVPRPFVSYDFGEERQSISGIEVIDSTYQNGAPSTLGFTSLGVKDAEFGYLATVTVLTSGGAPAAGATVTIQDNFGTTWPSGPATATDNTGLIILPVPVTKYVSGGSDTQNTTPVVTSLLPVTLTATSADGLHTGTATISAMSGDQSITITLN